MGLPRRYAPRNDIQAKLLTPFYTRYYNKLSFNKMAMMNRHTVNLNVMVMITVLATVRCVGVPITP